VVQIKHGPIDFQVREPVSPLFTHLRQTPSVNELQITQEYLGQQAHLVYLAPYWKEILDFDLRVDNKSTPLYDILGGRRFGTKRGGYAGVANVGMNSTWLGSHLAMSNLYAFGKLAWNPHNDPSEILDAWTRLTFSHDQEVVDTINHMSMVSWPMYENYTGNLGIQTLTNILNGHYGPDPLSQDGNPWGQWTRTDDNGVGMDRTTWNGTGFAGQYPTTTSSNPARQSSNTSTTPTTTAQPWPKPSPPSGRLSPTKSTKSATSTSSSASTTKPATPSSGATASSTCTTTAARSPTPTTRLASITTPGASRPKT
jgi:alpha-glucuronidase